MTQKDQKLIGRLLISILLLSSSLLFCVSCSLSNPSSITKASSVHTTPSEISKFSEIHTDDTISLTWKNPTTDFDHAEVYENNVLIGTSTSGNFEVKGLSPASTHTYKIVIVDPAGNKSAGVTAAISTEESRKVYNVEIARWNIYNDGSHPDETTKGINDALVWANQKGFTIFKVPAGTYLIKKGMTATDTTARINMVSNMTFLLDDQAVLEKETNGYPGYTIIYVGPLVHDVVLKGGSYQGDKDTHDYTTIPGTHEWGDGILTEGAVNVTIDGVKAYNFTGDGVMIGGWGKQYRVLRESDFESGAIDKAGNPTPSSTNIRTKSRISNIDSLFPLTQQCVLTITNPIGIDRNATFDIYFYKADGTFLSSLKKQAFNWSYMDVPLGASYLNIVCETSIYKGLRIELWVRSLAKNALLKNSEIYSNRRQGITVGGAANTLILNNTIHDIKGTAPQSGIDVEGGIWGNGDLNTYTYIENNNFYDNEAYNVILYDGIYGQVEGNILGPNANKNSIGVAVSASFKSNAVIQDNVFNGSKLVVEHDVVIDRNTMKDSLVSLKGPNTTIENMTLTNSALVVNSSQPFGVTANHITITNTNKALSGLVVNGQPVHLSDITISGPSLTQSIRGNVVGGSTFDHLTITGYSSRGLNIPRGTYNNSVFKGLGFPNVSQPGKYRFNRCSFQSGGYGLNIDNKDADITILNSRIETSGNNEIVYVRSARHVDLEENSLINPSFPAFAAWRGAVKINKYGQASNPTDVLNATIKGNTITTNISVKGISTIDAGIGAPAYDVEDNILYNAKLELRPLDINFNNIELQDKTVPSNVSNVTETHDAQKAILSWTNPTNNPDLLLLGLFQKQVDHLLRHLNGKREWMD